jgi:DNA repair photolyase
MITEIEAKSILRKQKKIDSWFISRYGMNLYRGCIHNCSYCDGRAESYQVAGEFGQDIEVKRNAGIVLKRELDPQRRRKPIDSGYILLGGGVCDSYQPAEQKHLLAQNALLSLSHFSLPVHVLTKSALIERDLDLIKDIHQSKAAIVSMSFSSVDDGISRIFEPGVPSPARRLQTLELFAKNSIPTGMYLMPVIPFITDTPEKMTATVRAAKNAGVQFIIFGTMTMKEGRQQDHFMHLLQSHFPDLTLDYSIIYGKDRYGQALPEYNNATHQTFLEIARTFNIPVRIPKNLFVKILNENDRVAVMLEHIDYFLKTRGQRSVYGYAAWSLSQQKEPLSLMRSRLGQISGVGETVAKVVKEILDTGTSRLYERFVGVNDRESDSAAV